MLIALIVLGVLVLGGFGIFGFTFLFKVEHDQKKAEDSAAAALDAAFDGRPDVTYPINMRSVKYETVILGAKQRGYKLVHQADNQYGPHTLMFERNEKAAPPDSLESDGAQAQ